MEENQRQREAISIHAPRTGSDRVLVHHGGGFGISIHAPRTGSDDAAADAARSTGNFNPRSPHGERHHPGLQSFAR